MIQDEIIIRSYAYEYESNQKESSTSDSHRFYPGFFYCHLACDPEYGFGRRTNTHSTFKTPNHWQSFDAAFGKEKFFTRIQFKTITGEHSFKYALGSVWNQIVRSPANGRHLSASNSAEDRHICLQLLRAFTSMMQNLTF